MLHFQIFNSWKVNIIDEGMVWEMEGEKRPDSDPSPSLPPLLCSSESLGSVYEGTEVSEGDEMAGFPDALLIARHCVSFLFAKPCISWLRLGMCVG